MKRCAFTIIELLTVISVIAFLSGIALPVLTGVVQKSKLARDINNLRQIGIALRAYQNDHDGNMPPDQGGYFIVSAQGNDQTLLSYTGSNFEVWHSSFDPRAITPGDASPVSYSINEKVLTPTGADAALREWNGNLSMSQVPLSQLIVAAPSFRTDGGAFSWDENIASMVYTLSQRVQEMFGSSTIAAPPSFYQRVPCLFADGHVELVPVENYQWTAENPANWVQWDPMGTNLPPLPLIAWETDTVEKRGDTASADKAMDPAMSFEPPEISFVNGIQSPQIRKSEPTAGLQSARNLANPRTSRTSGSSGRGRANAVSLD